jgi:hypothetical protein
MTLSQKRLPSYAPGNIEPPPATITTDFKIKIDSSSNRINLAERRKGNLRYSVCFYTPLITIFRFSKQSSRADAIKIEMLNRVSILNSGWEVFVRR